MDIGRVDAAVNWLVGPQGLSHFRVGRRDFPSRNRPSEFLCYSVGDVVGGLPVGRNQFRVEAALLAALATQGGEQSGQFGALNLIHEGRSAD